MNSRRLDQILDTLSPKLDDSVAEQVRAGINAVGTGPNDQGRVNSTLTLSVTAALST